MFAYRNFSIFIGILLLCSLTTNGEEYSYTWVEYHGRKVKKWNINNDQYFFNITNTPSLSKNANRIPQNKPLSEKVDDVALKEEELFLEKKQSLSLGLSFSSISINSLESAVATNEIAVSDISYGVNLRWSHLWSEKYEFIFDASLSQYKFTVTQEKTLLKSKLSKTYIGVGLKYNQSKKNQYSIGLGIGESFILLGKNQAELEIDKASIPALSVSGSHGLSTFKNGYSFGAFWRLGLLAPVTESSYSTDLGHYWNLGFHSRLGNKLNVNISYGQRKLNTEHLEQVSKGLSIGCGVGFKF